jgi:hypothetical protein
MCARCGVEVPAERIEALPDTQICVDCSREIGGEYKMTVVLGNLGKGGSLKKNYGEVSVKMTRRRIRRKDEE